MIVNFSKSQLLRGTILTPGWFKASIKSLEEKLSRDKESMNHKYTFAVVQPGRPDDERIDVEHIFNSKAMGRMIPFIVAMTGKKPQEIIDGLESGEFAFDTESVIGKELQVRIKNEEYEGNLQNRTEAWIGIDAEQPF